MDVAVGEARTFLEQCESRTDPTESLLSSDSEMANYDD